MKFRSCALSFLGLIAALTAISALVYGSIELLQYTFEATHLSKEVTASIVAAVGTILSSVAAMIYNQRKSKEREIAEAHRPEKVRVYSSFMETMVKQLRKEKNEERRDFESEVIDELFKFKRDLIVWGSPGVINEFLEFEEKARGEVENHADILIHFDRILQEVRADLGNSNWSLQDGDLVQLLLTDDLQEVLGKNSESMGTT